MFALKQKRKKTKKTKKQKSLIDNPNAICFSQEKFKSTLAWRKSNTKENT